MSWFGDQVATVTTFVCLFIVLAAFFKIFHKLWWTPTQIQKLMALQGIKGPSYRLIHGNTKEISNMRKEAMARPRNLSHEVFALVQPHLHSWTKIYGKNFLQWDGPQPVLVITDPELCKEILNNKHRAYPKSNPSAFVMKLLGDGLVTRKEGEKWAKLRKLANHAFHGESLKSQIHAMIASAETMLERWENHEGKEIEAFEEFRLLTSDVISRTAFGSSYLEGKDIFEMLLKISTLTFKTALKPKFPGLSRFVKTSDEIEMEKLEKRICETIIEIVKKRERKVMPGEEESLGSDFLGLLLKAYHDTNDNQRISLDDLVDECKTFYLAGHESTATFLAWTVFLLALHTDWQEEARKEVLQVFGKQTPNPKGIAKLKTMSMIMYESLRLYPPVASVVRRRVEREVKLGRLILPANLELLIPIVAFHYDSELWGQDVQLFKPERFAEGVVKATKENIAAFLPFGMGPRICVGLDFATTEAKIALSMILQRHVFTLSPAYTHSPSQFLTVRPQHGVQVMLHSL
ncbi:cytochrome P450 CYP749A22-like [Prunus avium]|uniref:Cytochrome P450 CYP749A22-like n=1 Tax=Prunus avium TaxID=42229 RepID=A0A6P5TD98_PRUAV|nr:cytochrome P450 CYP749A22-like [Prunus avium]